MKYFLFLSNEKKVKQAAKEEGFTVVGTIGIILKKEINITKSEEFLMLYKQVLLPACDIFMQL
ncbi:MAG TPA: hypothetical protein ENH01_02260 [Nitrospirae bacterium]|nr:hypothetical protein [Nitrospirota bacterium]